MSNSGNQKQSGQRKQRELRVSARPQRFEVRTNSDGSRTVAGYFATFGTMSHDLGFREILKKGCFSEGMRNQPVACYRDHNSQMLLGKTESSTLEVLEDDKGISFRVKLPDTSYANDLVALMERGDSYECSFGMVVAPDGEEWSQLPNGEILRTITKALLFEGSILTGPAAAYPKTSANLRSCPADIRAKLTKRDDEDDDDLDCDGVDADDPRCDNDEEDRACDCRCNSCAEDGDCLACSIADCTSELCLSNRCGMRERSMHFQLITRRLRR